MIKVMQHFDNGGEDEIEFKRTIEDDAKWEKLLPVPVWNWERFDYRIKEQKQKVTIEKWLIKDVNSGEHFIMESSDVNLNLKVFLELRKLKLLESYEIEL